MRSLDAFIGCVRCSATDRQEVVNGLSIHWASESLMFNRQPKSHAKGGSHAFD